MPTTRRLLRLTLAALLATLGLAASAEAAQRYASPGGSGTACTETNPCDLDTAVEDVTVQDNDEVIVTPGTYTVAGLAIDEAIVLHGQAGQSTPTINTSAVFGIDVGAAATIRDLITTASSGTAMFFNSANATVERVKATATGAGIACWVAASVTIRDSICHGSHATNGSGIGSNASLLAGPRTVTLRNVTAFGSIGGLNFGYQGNGVNFTIDAKSVVASGNSYDVAAHAAQGATIQITLEHSNYDQEFEFEDSNPASTASITDPGTGTGNQTDPPLFVDPAAGDFHQEENSPTIDAGVLDSSSGTADFEGDGRSLDSDGLCPDEPAPDIGADEYNGDPGDCDPPETTISGGPTGTTNDSTPTFNLESDEPSSTFECSIDGGAFALCTTPYTTPTLTDGSHTLEVRATDSTINANTDPTPASRTFTVDATAPGTTITGGPNGVTADSTPTFQLSTDDPGATFECRIDSGGFAPCTTPYTTAALADGGHTLEVRATDQFGNVDATPASRTFSIDATAPQTTITSAPRPKVKTKRKRVRVTFTFAADEAATFECALDGAAFAPCTSPLTKRVGKGKHTLAVRATDTAGNAESSPATASFKIKRKRPRR